MPLPLSGVVHEAPPGADFVWFIYGSSLDARAFAAWAEQHGHAAPDLSRGRPARLDGYRLSFDVASRFWGGPVGSLLPEPGAWVEGLALAMAGAARPLAEHKEGAVSGLYRAQEVSVTSADGSAPLSALAYVASPDRRQPEAARPAAAWLETVIRGARAAHLSDEWVARLERLAAPPG